MRLQFTKMQGAGNDFVVLDATRTPIDLSPAQLRQLADRRFGVGADQILMVGPSKDPSNDFSYRIINADGNEVEHCGNGARCFMRFVQERGLSQKNPVRVEVCFGVLSLQRQADGNVRAEIAVPRFAPAQIPFNPAGLNLQTTGDTAVYALPLSGATRLVSVVNLGNPHAVQIVADVDTAPVLTEGPQMQNHPAFPEKINAGFMQIIDRQTIRLRVFERGVGETLACGTGACAAVVVGIRQGHLDSPVTVHAPGGTLRVDWAGAGQMTYLSGPAVTVFEGNIEL